MIHLLWGLVNIGVFIFFIAICFKATKLIREKWGFFASVIFVFGLLSFAGNAGNNNDNKEPNSNHFRTWKFVSEDSLQANESHLLTIDLEKTLVSKYGLGVTYGKDKQGKTNVPINAYSSVTGFVSGINWKPVSISVNGTSDNHHFQYHVDGVIEWKLLGATIYSQSKKYKGTAILD